MKIFFYDSKRLITRIEFVTSTITIPRIRSQREEGLEFSDLES